MVFMQGTFTLFILLGLSHVLCILAKKEEGIVRTVGYTLAVCLVILSILYIITEVDTCGGSLTVEKATPKAMHRIQATVKK
jgi:hypothetical protein